MSKIRISRGFPSAFATITALSEARYFPASNSQLHVLSDVYKSGVTLASEALQYDFGEAIEVDLLVLLRHNLTPDDTIKFQTSSDGTYGAPTSETTLLFHAGNLVQKITPVTTRYCRFLIVKAAAANQISIAYAGVAVSYDFPRNPDRDSIGWDTEDFSEVEQAISGESSAFIGAQARVFSCQVKYAPNSMRLVLQEVAAFFGKHTPFLLIFQPDPAITDPYDEMIFGRFTKLPEYRGWTGVEGLREIAFAMTEETTLDLD